MIDTAARPMAMECGSERLTVVPCPSENPKTGRRCGYTLMEAWTSGVCVERRRCKQCGVWYWVRLTSDGQSTTFPEGGNLVD